MGLEVGDGGAEGIAAGLEILELVERSAGRRQQHDRSGDAGLRGVVAAARTARASVAAISVVTRPFSVAANILAASPIR